MQNNRYREEEKEIEVEETPVKANEHESIPHKKDKRLLHKIEQLEKRIAELETDLAKNQNEMLKDRAELENFKRRTNEERIKDRKYAIQDFLTSLIDSLDVLDRVTSKETEDEKLKKYLLGFSMINQQIFTLLEEQGVKRVDSLNKPFDPSNQMAVEVVYNPDVASNTVLEEISRGYTFKDRVLRPALVKVSTTEIPNEETPSETEENNENI